MQNAIIVPGRPDKNEHYDPARPSNRLDTGMDELWQLYNEQGSPITGKGASKDDIFSKGILHGAAHVWIWRNTKEGKQVLLQRRAANKRTWPNTLDISAAGHIDLGETPIQAALRETREEIGLNIDETSLRFLCKHRMHIVSDSGDIENEFRWIYLLEITTDTSFTLQDSEVSSIQWMPIEEFKKTILPNNGDYAPQGDDYFELLIHALEEPSNNLGSS